MPGQCHKDEQENLVPPASGGRRPQHRSNALASSGVGRALVGTPPEIMLRGMELMSTRKMARKHVEVAVPAAQSLDGPGT